MAACLPGFAQTSQVVCNAAASAVTVRAGGAAERTADLVVTCTGGFSTGQGQTILPMTWLLTFGVTATSRPLSAGWSDALLVVDEPQPFAQSACLTANGVCTVVSTGNPQRTYDGAAGRPNVFQAEYNGNVLAWRGIPFDPPGSGTTRVFRFTNLRVAALAAGNISVSVAVPSGQIPVTITNATQVVAVPQTPVIASAGGAEASNSRLSKFTVSIAEQFANVMKANSSAGPSATPQAGPGEVGYGFETGFYNPNLAASPRGNLSFAGLADNGTRVRIGFSGVPAAATVTVPLSVNFGSAGVARLVATDTNGIGQFTPVSNTTLSNDKGVVVAVYEIVQSSPTAVETLAVPFTLSYASGAPLLQSLAGEVALAPVNASQIADNSPIPRFNDPLAIAVSAPRDPLGFVTTSVPSGAVGTAYSQTITATGGLPPYTFSALPSTPAPGLSLSSLGVLAGTPALPGTFSFSATVRDSAQGSVTTQFTITVGAAGSLLQTSLSKLEFSAVLGGGIPALQAFRVSSAQNAQPFTLTVDGGTPAWLQITPLTGAAPGLVTVGVNPGNLGEGTYTARIRVALTGNSNVPPVEVTVTFVVKPATPRLESSVSRLTISTRTPSPVKREVFVVLRNAGGGGGLPFTAAVLARSPWLTSVTPLSAIAGPAGTGVRIAMDSTGLSEGIYRDMVRFTSAFNSVDVPLTLRVVPAGPLLDVSSTAVRFSMREGVRTQVGREIKVLNNEPGSNLLWSAEWIRGGEYFSFVASNGSATTNAPGLIRVSVNPSTASLKPGAYYGLLRVTGASALRYVVAVLQVRPATQAPDLELDTGGFVFTALTGGAGSRRLVTLNATSQSAIPYQAAASTADGTAWLSVSPLSGNVSSTQSASLAIAVDPRSLTAGVYRGEVTMSSVDASQTLPVMLVVTDASSEVPAGKARAAACSANRMAVGSTGLANNFTVPAGWPATLTVEVRDNCSTAVSNATVVARFSNGDPPMTLDADGLTGVYSGTWQPGTPLEQANVTFSALNAEFPEARAVLIGAVKENKVPTLFRDGTIHNLDPKLGGLLAPGLVAQMYGTDLAAVAESTGSVPLATNYKNTSVLVGPYEAPLYYVSPGQLVVQLPSELPANRTYPILVSANGALTIPDQIDVVAVQPGVAAFSDGRLIAQHSNFVLVDSANPAKRGEFLIMYLVGLGGTNQLVASGAPSPGTSPLPVLNVVPTVTVDGAPAQVVFAGLTPGGVGLYQINFKVPDNARLNAPLDVAVKQGAYTANVTTLTVVQ